MLEKLSTVRKPLGGRALVGRTALDRLLAGGAAQPAAAELRRRTVDLVSPRNRRALARDVERLIDIDSALASG